MLNYIIAQGAAPNFWHKFYDIDPGEVGLHPVHSVHKTPEGIGVQKTYTEKEFNTAIKDCELLNKRYPDKGYAVVRML